MLVLDTSILIGSWPPPEDAAVSTVAVGELHAGVALAKDAVERRHRAARLEAVLAQYDILPVDLAVAEAFGDLLARSRRENGPRNRGDLLIAATALAHGVDLATADKRLAAFARRAGLAVVEPPPR